MFEDTLLIIKSDYMHKRKSVLLKLLQKDFQIQGHRKVLFSPEHAAEFYKDLAEDKCFMLQVILLSKGNAEAFILTKENAVEDLVNTMVCYFLTSMEMERNVHVSKNPDSVRREISFIFPNYIHEPVPYFEQPKFCQTPLMAPLINELYEIIQGGGSGPSGDQQQNWRLQLAEWLTVSNKTLPHISNQCSGKPTIGYEEKGQQAGSSFKRQPQPVVCTGAATICAPRSSRSASLTLSSAGSSAMITSSSCITCSCFDGRSGEICLHRPPHDPCDMVRRRVETPPREEPSPPPPESSKTDEEEQRTGSAEEHFEWQRPPCESELEEVEEEFNFPPEPSDVPSHESPPTVMEDVPPLDEMPPEQLIEAPPEEPTEVPPDEPTELPPEEPTEITPEEPKVEKPELPEPTAEAPPAQNDNAPQEEQIEIETAVGPAHVMQKLDKTEAPADVEDEPPPE